MTNKNYVLDIVVAMWEYCYSYFGLFETFLQPSLPFLEIFIHLLKNCWISLLVLTESSVYMLISKKRPLVLVLKSVSLQKKKLSN